MSILNIHKVQLYLYFILILVIFDNNIDVTANITTHKELDTIFLRLYRDNENTYKDVSLEDAKSLIELLDENKYTMLYIHGYTESVKSKSVLTVIKAYFNRSDHNMIAVDWSILAKQNYIQVASSVIEVGVHIAKAIEEMFNEGLSRELFYIVSHSMGCHVAGALGRNIVPRLERIIGLDPAGPLFNLIKIKNPLNIGDAKNLQIIHTDYGFFGKVNTMGTIDFWPNGGDRIQPGCPLIFIPFSPADFCSHHRSWIYYSESLRNKSAYTAIPCPENRNPRADAIPMGFDTPLNASGNYYLKTLSKSPYGLGEAGEKCPIKFKLKLARIINKI